MPDPQLGPRPGLLNVQQLYNKDTTSAFLLPAYMGNLRGRAAEVLLKDEQCRRIDLTRHADLDRTVQLHLLALPVHDRYRMLWRRCTCAGIPWQSSCIVEMGTDCREPRFVQ